MAMYWLKQDESVAGPFEARIVAYVPGFREETLVQPDDPAYNNLWMKAAEIKELDELYFHPSPKTTRLLTPAIDPVQLLPNKESSPLLAVQQSSSVLAGTTTIFPQETSAETKSTLEVPKKDSEILRMMEDIAKEAPADLIAPTFPTQDADKETSSGTRAMVIIVLCCAVAVATYIGWRYFKLKQTPKPAPAPVVSTPKPTPVTPIKTKRIVPTVKEKPKKEIAAETPKTQEDISLQNQKYMLPGVPAPNVQNEAAVNVIRKENITGDEPAIPQKEPTPEPTATPSKKEKKEKSPEKTTKKFDDMQWISESGWGK